VLHCRGLDQAHPSQCGVIQIPARSWALTFPTHYPLLPASRILELDNLSPSALFLSPDTGTTPTHKNSTSPDIPSFATYYHPSTLHHLPACAKRLHCYCLLFTPLDRSTARYSSVVTAAFRKLWPSRSLRIRPPPPPPPPTPPAAPLPRQRTASSPRANNTPTLDTTLQYLLCRKELRYVAAPQLSTFAPPPPAARASCIPLLLLLLTHVRHRSSLLTLT
jgi:hypothetical protein